MPFVYGMIFLLFAAGSAFGQDVNPDAGRAYFETYCWQCHGKTGTGVGPMAEMLAIEPPDLTTLAQRNGGVFPLDAVARQIDGRDPMLAHGGDMPLYGSVLESTQTVAWQLPSGQPLVLSVPLAEVVAYLETLQAE